jgi:hypothetical protein
MPTTTRHPRPFPTRVKLLGPSATLEMFARDIDNLKNSLQETERLLIAARRRVAQHLSLQGGFCVLAVGYLIWRLCVSINISAPISMCVVVLSIFLLIMLLKTYIAWELKRNYGSTSQLVHTMIRKERLIRDISDIDSSNVTNGE